MWQSSRTRIAALTTGALALGLGTAVLAAWTMRSHEAVLQPREAAGEVAPMPAPGLAAEESGMPPPALRLRAIVARAWDDSIVTWKRLMRARAVEIASVNLRFVKQLTPMNCYGLYAGEGPAYCSGNHTIFVGTDAANRLMARLGPQAEAGITFLIGHEMGHHIQNLHGRFQYLSRALASAPASRTEIVRRFELEADCFAGVWVHGSGAWARSGRFRSELRAVLKSIGDETILGARPAAAVAMLGVHGTSEQRRRWFTRGAENGDLDACNTFSAARP